MKDKSTERNRPSSEELKAELRRARYVKRYRRTLWSTIYSLITVAAIAVLVATIFLPVFQIYGSSMTPTLWDGDIVVSFKHAELKRQDVIAFYFNNKILVKRVIGVAGDWIDIDDNGNVCVNGKVLEEPYLSEKALGEYDIDFPYQVPAERVFVLGDHRQVSMDSRSKAVGCISEEQIVGKLVYRVWPFDAHGYIK